MTRRPLRARRSKWKLDWSPHAKRSVNYSRIAEGRGLRIIDEAKSRAIEEANKIISGAKAEAEAEAIRRGMDFGGTRVQRVIEFPPELKQAGIGILSYFL